SASSPRTASRPRWRWRAGSRAEASAPASCSRRRTSRCGSGASSVLAEVRLADVLVLAERLGIVREGDRAGLEDVAAVGDLERHQRVLLDEQDRGALLVDLDHDLEDLLDEDRRQTH